ncbi:hypothetical protein BCV70DRAFT_56864 [Testicularia cyperi]|uniref:Uncharacterized protein n=1 Tax=Testicularia cyperi TaxID=1882483 RepID=A0A317XUX9_9BASI|nr:hypothetical protein BCV70DRAFT_56864 [Testicularia cyperi]
MCSSEVCWSQLWACMAPACSLPRQHCKVLNTQRKHALSATSLHQGSRSCYQPSFSARVEAPRFKNVRSILVFYVRFTCISRIEGLDAATVCSMQGRLLIRLRECFVFPWMVLRCSWLQEARVYLEQS